MSQHDVERISELENLSNIGLGRFSGGAAKLVLLLGASAALNSNRIVHIFVCTIFVRGIGGLI
jgi:hypothetical protein